MKAIAEKAYLNRECLCRTLSRRINPEISTIALSQLNHILAGMQTAEHGTGEDRQTTKGVAGGDCGKVKSDFQEHPFHVMESNKANFSIIPFEFFVCRLQSQIMERDIMGNLLNKLNGAGYQMQ